MMLIGRKNTMQIVLGLKDEIPAAYLQPCSYIGFSRAYHQFNDFLLYTHTLQQYLVLYFIPLKMNERYTQCKIQQKEGILIIYFVVE